MKSIRRNLGKARNIAASLALARVQSRARAQGQRSIVVVGARRSGHHAVIHWLANSFEERQVEWERLGTDEMFVSTSRTTAHLNNWRLARGKSASWRNLRFRRHFQSCDFLFVNYEDVDPLILDQRMWFPARPDFKVVVRRSTLNVVASRMKRAEKRPSSRSFLIDEPFLESMMKFRSETPGWVLIDFDLWLRNEDGYRAKIADRLGLTSGDDPALSSHGGGSSFVGTERIPGVSELTNRFSQVEWPERIVKMLLDDRYSSLLTSEERDFLRSTRG